MMQLQEDMLKARMRLAVNQATISFPKRIDLTPIVLGVRLVFIEVWRSLPVGQHASYDEFDPHVLQLIGDLARKTAVEIRCKNVPGQLAVGRPALEAKAVAQLVSGLDSFTARTLLGFRNQGASPAELEQRRMGMLLNRRNLLANRLVEDSEKCAGEYFMKRVAVRNA